MRAKITFIISIFNIVSGHAGLTAQLSTGVLPSWFVFLWAGVIVMGAIGIAAYKGGDDER